LDTYAMVLAAVEVRADAVIIINAREVHSQVR
jgi:hypothetical protein